MNGSARSQECHSTANGEKDRRGSCADLARGDPLGADLKALTRVVGLILSDMGVRDPDASLLEPVARAIHSLSASGPPEDPR